MNVWKEVQMSLESFYKGMSPHMWPMACPSVSAGHAVSEEAFGQLWSDFQPSLIFNPS